MQDLQHLATEIVIAQAIVKHLQSRFYCRDTCKIILKNAVQIAPLYLGPFKLYLPPARGCVRFCLLECLAGGVHGQRLGPSAPQTEILQPSPTNLQGKEVRTEGRSPQMRNPHTYGTGVNG